MEGGNVFKFKLMFFNLIEVFLNFCIFFINGKEFYIGWVVIIGGKIKFLRFMV